MKEFKYKNILLKIKKEDYINFIIDNEIWQEFTMYLFLKRKGVYNERNKKPYKLSKNI